VLIIHQIHPAFIVAFCVTILLMLILDLGVFNKNPHVVSNKEALVWSVVWVGLAMIFSLFIWKYIDFEAFTEFQSAYWIEKALSIDNLFVFILVFSAFKVEKKLHHRVLFWGIIGALLMRAIFIFSGVKLINMTYLNPTDFGGMLAEPIRINVLLTIFGVILLIAGFKSAFKNDDPLEKPEDFSNGTAAKIMKKLFRIVPRFDGDKFFTIENGKRVGTTLLMVLGVIEFSDLIFAVDSIPAIFAITDDPFILYTSNIFAILGLRSLYFLLANYISRFHLLKYGLGFILVFIGVKMLINPFYHIPSPISLTIVASALLLTTVLSLIIKPKES
jgi:tellurite resistance protein TerC